jgi:hypothetical protein
MKALFTLLFTICMINLYGAEPGIAGSWKGTMKSPDGNEMEIVFVFKMTGDSLSGTVNTFNGDMPISNSKVDGKNFYFEVAFNDMVIKHNCTLKDDGTISMKASGLPSGDMELNLVRKE